MPEHDNFVSAQLTPEGLLAVPKTEGDRVLFLLGRFRATGRFVPEQTVSTEDPAWYELDDLLAAIKRGNESAEKTWRKGYKAGLRYYQNSERLRHGPDQKPMVWLDDHGLLVVRNPEGRAYSHLEWKNDQVGWQWAANMDELPESARPLFHPDLAPQALREMLGDVEIEVVKTPPEYDMDAEYESEFCADTYYVKNIEPSGRQHNLNHLDNLGTPVEPAKVAAAVDRAKRRLAVLLDIQAELDAAESAEVDRLIDVILANEDLDIDREGARDIALRMLATYNLEERDV
ncbi:hypothetical protein SEA_REDWATTLEHOG_125 [Gordonia phage RedWattleHog]|nr:hypothetical protein SEA_REDWATTLEHOG_125 [Gordonia phage RedWattleHog]